MTAERPVDPRYDPAFQRGFDGEVTAVPRRRPQTEARFESLTEAGSAAEGQHSPAAEPALHAGPRTPPLVETHDLDKGEGLAPSTRPASLRVLVRNPFLVAAAAIGASLVVGGSVWAAQANDLITGVQNEHDYFLLQTTAFGAPLAIVTGIAIISGVLFVAAAAWNRR